MLHLYPAKIFVGELPLKVYKTAPGQPNLACRSIFMMGALPNSRKATHLSLHS